jgi:hypothetical protein
MSVVALICSEAAIWLAMMLSAATSFALAPALPDAQQGRGDAAANEQQFMFDDQLAMNKMNNTSR